jgi:hypothetical protein
VGEKGIVLEYIIHRSLVNGKVRDIALAQKDPAAVDLFKTGDSSKKGRFATAAWT